MDEGTVLTDGMGLTVMVYEAGVPVQPATVGVTVMVPLMDELPGLVAVNGGTLPDPLAPKPMAVLELVQVNEPPAGVLVKALPATGVPVHTPKLEGTVTVGVGFTVMVYVDGVPVQPAELGVTVIVPLIGELPALVAVKVGMFPLPLAAKPIEVFELVQLNDPLAGVIAIPLAGTLTPLQ